MKKLNVYTTIFNSKDSLPKLKREKHYSVEDLSGSSPQKIATIVYNTLKLHERTEEYLYGVMLNVKLDIIAICEISHGSIMQTIASTRETMLKALLCGATSIVLVHNHPSGMVEASSYDKKSFEEMKIAGETIGIAVVDSLVLGGSMFYSMQKDSVGRIFNTYDKYRYDQIDSVSAEVLTSLHYHVSKTYAEILS